MKLNAKVNYLGQSSYNSDDRFAVIDCNEEQTDLVCLILDEIGMSYDIFDSNRGSCFYVRVEDYEDYKDFMRYWKQTKKEFSTIMSKNNTFEFDFSK